ncbi:MAG TPA: HD domain-containing protein [Cytophagaceae bacterium]|jgi:hypothetical protein
MNKKKIINDPVYGFITIPSDSIFDIIEHPWFQRLRRIKQLGLADFVYPGALHTRFHHAIGAMHLMGIALETLRSKEVEISENEFEAAQIAILLHDSGHGPFSHALEHTLLASIHHEKISSLVLERLSRTQGGNVSMALKMFNNTYPRKFFHQLISSQLDMDRLDYLNRDCFFTGVSEGAIGLERIIRMLNIHDDSLVVEEKGIYSIENFLNARRLMYWQVYLHKTTVSAEKMIIKIIQRAKHLIRSGENLTCSPSLQYFLSREVTLQDFENNEEVLMAFTKVDDYDIWGAIKFWCEHTDKVLSMLCNMILKRKLFKIEISETGIDTVRLTNEKKQFAQSHNLSLDDTEYFFESGVLTNAAYFGGHQKINILTKSGKIIDVAAASDLPNIKAIRKIVTKHYVCFPKTVYL